MMSRRRAVLLSMGGGASVAMLGLPATAGTAAAAEKPDEKVKSRYRETDHVRTFYSVNKYPAS